MPVKINLTIHDNNENDVQLSIKDGTFNNIGSEVTAFFENHFDFDDWAYETVKCSELCNSANISKFWSIFNSFVCK